MPPLDPAGTRRRRPRRRAAPRPPAPRVQRQQALSQERAYGSQGRAVQRQATRQRPVAPPSRRSGAFGPISGQPFARQQRKATRKVRYARSGLPDHPAIRYIPIKRAYTPQEIIAIHHIYRRGAQQAGVRSVNQLFDLGSGRQQRNMLAVSRAVERTPFVQARQRRMALDTVKPGQRQSGLSKGLASLTDDIARAATVPGTHKTIAALAGEGIVGVPSAAFKYGIEGPAVTAYNLGRVTVEHPAAVAKSSLRTAVESIAGIPQGVKAIFDDPKKAIGAIASDYERRYGSILSDPAKFRRQVASDYGLTPFVLDAAALAGGTGTAAGAVARAGAFGRAVDALSHIPGTRIVGKAGQAVRRTATAERPVLREFAGEGGAKAQRVSKNLGVAAGQRVLDRTRAARYRRTLERAGLQELPGGRLRRVGEKTPKRIGALRPGQGEVLRLPNLRDAPLLRRYTGHAARDIGHRQSIQRLQLLTHRGRTLREINQHLAKLPTDERAALKYMLELGVKPDANGVRALRMRLAKMTRARKGSGRSVAPILGDTNDEVRLIRTILKSPERYLTPEARQVADELRTIQLREATRDPTLAPEQELIQRHTKQAELLGVPRRSAPVQEHLAHVEGVARKGLEPVDDAAAFAERTRQAAHEAGLSEPAYFMSSPRPEDTTALAAVGRGMRAAHPNRRYTGALHEIGAEEHGHHVLVQGVERNIKRRFQHQLVARNIETHAFEWSRGKGNAGLTVSEIKRQLDTRMIDPKSVQLMDTKILTRRDEQAAGLERGRVVTGTEDPFSQETAALHEHLRDMPTNLTNEDIQRLAQQRFVVVPRDVGEAVDGLASKLDGPGMRAWEVMFKQKPSRIILGLANIPWLSIQAASNAFLTGIGGGVNPLDVVGGIRFDRWLRHNDPEAHAAWESEIGITHGHSFAMDQPNLGATSNHIVAFWRAYKHTKVGRGLHRANPLDAMFRVNEAQDNFFRRTLFHSTARKAAYRRMGVDWRGIDNGISRLTQRVLALPPERQMAALARNGPEFERVAKHVDDFLGNYTKFTPSERFLLSRNVMFYGYLRFSLRFAFYTMPVQHPIMAGILSNIGRLGAQDIKQLFGVPSNYQLPTNMLGAAYFGNRKDAKRGTLGELNIGRMNPFLNSVTQLQSAEQLTGLVSPLMQDIADQMFTESSFTGKDWKILGQTPPDSSERPNNYYGSILGAAIPGRPRNQILLRNLLQLATPYRIAEKTGIPNVNLPLLGHVPGTGVPPLEGPQSDDTNVWSPRPVGYSNPATVKSIQRSIRQQRKRGAGPALLDQLLPFMHPAPTRNADIIKREREKQAAARQAQRRRALSPAKRRALEHRVRSRAAKKAARTRSGGSGGWSGSGGWGG